MATTEARTLTAWVVIATRDWAWQHRDLEKVGTERHGPTLLQRAEVELGQSLVPGARELLDLTKIEIDEFREQIPWAAHMPDVTIEPGPHPSAESALLSQGVAEFRADRIFERVRAWASDPERIAGDVSTALRAAKEDLEAHMDYRQGLTVDGLRPLHDLPPKPERLTDEVAALVNMGLIPPRAKT